jgi:hypothetical protein
LTAELKPWANRTTGRYYEIIFEGKLLFYRKDGRLITEICRGDRYAHVTSGYIFQDETYIGSTLDDWYGGPQGDLSEMIPWIAESELEGAQFWFQPPVYRGKGNTVEPPAEGA